MNCYAGIDAGADRHHLAVVDEHGNIVDGGLPGMGMHLDEVVDLLIARWSHPAVIAIDAPCELAPDGARSRACERQLQGEVGCSIYFTPEAKRLDGHWWAPLIRSGLALHDALRRAGCPRVVEVFPTASLTRWAGPRGGGESRARWSRRVLVQQASTMGVESALPTRWNQHQRDALTAAWTALQVARGEAIELDGPGSPPGIWVPEQARGAPHAHGPDSR